MSVLPPSGSSGPESAGASPGSRIGFLLGLPLFAVSFLTYRYERAVTRALERFLKRHPEAARWSTLAERLSKPFATLYVMVSGPRWNTHARIVTLGPFDVDRVISFDRSSLDESTEDWYLVVYRSPGHDTCLLYASEDEVPDGGDEVSLEIGPGTFAVVARFYNAEGSLELPAVHLDGGAGELEGRSVPAEPPPYTPEVFGTDSLLYRLLHFYIYFALKYRRYFGEGFVRREYLPVGNPATEFLYGWHDAGERIVVACSDEVRAAYHLYCTCYNRSSFPVHSHQVEDDASASTPVLREPGTYLLRFVAKRGASRDAALPDVSRSVEVRREKGSRAAGPVAASARPVSSGSPLDGARP